MNRFFIIVPVYNGEKVIGRCIESILSQDYKNFGLAIIDDCSTDRTKEIIKSYNFLSYKQFLTHPVSVYSNTKRTGSAVQNITNTIRISPIRDNDIIVEIDGDDYLKDSTVLSYLDSVYTSNVWMTYGQYEPLSGKFKNPCSLLSAIKTPNEKGQIITVSVTSREYRRSGYWVTSHPKTFRKWLFDRIDVEDFKKDGEFLTTCCDVCKMFPMIEMAGSHAKFIDKVLYVYDDVNNGWGKNAELNLKNFEYLQNKPLYDEL